MAEYSVVCECGLNHSVLARQAGSTLECRCGRNVSVPTLSKLRDSAGEAPYVLDAIERVEAMIQRGELPVGNVCPFSSRPANDTLSLHVQCERLWVRGGERIDSGKAFLLMYLFGWVGLLLALRRTR